VEPYVLRAAALLADALLPSSSLVILRIAEYVIVLVPVQRCVPTVIAARPARRGMRPQAWWAEPGVNATLVMKSTPFKLDARVSIATRSWETAFFLSILLRFSASHFTAAA